jgi:capsular exopolysaccharide synthesis family protein
MDPQLEEQPIDLRQYLGILAARKTTVIITALVLVAAALFFSYQQTPQYTSTARVLVKALPTNPNDVYLAPPNLETEGEIVKSQPVAALVKDDLNLPQSPDELLGDLTVTPIPDSEVLVISYTSPDPALSRDSADSFSTNYIKYRVDQALESLLAAQEAIQKRVDRVRTQIEAINAQIAAAREAGDTSLVNSLETDRSVLLARLGVLQQRLDDVQPDRSVRLGGGNVIEDATLPTSPSSPNHKLNALLGLAIGLALGVALAFLRERLDDTFRGRADVAKATQAPVLAAVPSFRPSRDRILELATLAEPKGSAAEAYRSLRTSFQFLAMEQDLKSVLVTSASAGEGKTVTSCNLAITLAQTGNRVVLVSADLRRPTVEKYFRISERDGLSEWLLGKHEDIWPLTKMPGGITNLRVLPSGRVPPNPAELLSSMRLTELIRRLREHSDFVIFDSPPSLPVADASILASQVGGTILVIDSSKTRRTTATHAAQELQRIGGNLLGTVLNAFEPQGRYSYYDTYYPTYYGLDHERSSSNGNGKRSRPRRKLPFRTSS